MTTYADYTFYTDDYLGTTIASGDFARLALLASAVIDQITFNRAAVIIEADDPAAYVTAIKMAACALAEEIQTQNTEGNVDCITSESTGNHSISYGTNAKAAQTSDTKLKRAAKVYLSNTGLLFAGFAEGEYAD